MNGIALSAIVFRISEWGITPNRLSPGGNILILINLLLVTYRQFQALRERNSLERVETSIAAFLPIYIAWAALAIFLFPILFGYE